MVWFPMGGKGWQAGGKGGWKGAQNNNWRKAPRPGGGKKKVPVPADFEINTIQRYTGTVTGYWKFKGFGFITLDVKGLVPNDEAFVHWKDIESADRFPMLMKGAQVQFNLKKAENKGDTCISACNVSLPGGVPVSFQDEEDSKKNFVGGQNIRYTGTLKFYIPERGYGYVAIDTAMDPSIPKEIRVETAEVNAGGAQPGQMKDVQVEFGIWKTKNGAYKAYNMTMPGGGPLSSS